MFPNRKVIAKSQDKALTTTCLVPPLSRGNHFSMIKMMTAKKWMASEEAPELSGVPVRQVQEDLVRDRGFKHRKLAQMACRRILNFAPLLWQDVGKAELPQ